MGDVFLEKRKDLELKLKGLQLTWSGKQSEYPYLEREHGLGPFIFLGVDKHQMGRDKYMLIIISKKGRATLDASYFCLPNGRPVISLVADK